LGAAAFLLADGEGLALGLASTGSSSGCFFVLKMFTAWVWGLGVGVWDLGFGVEGLGEQFLFFGL
jgi:hypothetical protein